GRDRDAADMDGIELRPRVEGTGPADPDVDLLERRHRGRGRPLVRTRPAGPLVQRAEPSLLIEVVDLDHDAVDLVPSRRPRPARLRDVLDRLEALGVRVRAEAVLAQPHEHLPLRLREVAV